MSGRRLEVTLRNPNGIFINWLERWLLEAERKDSKSKYKLQEAIDALKKYPLPLSSGKECAILRGFGLKLCNLIDEEMRKQKLNSQGININSDLYEEEVKKIIVCLHKAKQKVSPSKEIPRKVNKRKLQDIVKEKERMKQIIMTPGMFEILLLVDTQETSVKNKKNVDHTLVYLNSLNVKYEVRRLTVGDFVWIARNKEGDELVLPYIVERKRMDDLASSIRDGRFFEQKHRLKQSGLQHVIYLIEDYGDNQHIGLPLDNLNQALSNILIYNNFAIEHTENNRSSMKYLHAFTQMLLNAYKDKILLSCDKEDVRIVQPTQPMVGLLKFKSFYEDSTRNAQLTIRELFIQQLLQLHLLSLEKSLAIAKLYPTPRCLINAYDNCSTVNEARNLLANIKYGQLARPLGEKLSRLIYDFYRSDF